MPLMLRYPILNMSLQVQLALVPQTYNHNRAQPTEAPPAFSPLPRAAIHCHAVHNLNAGLATSIDAVVPVCWRGIYVWLASKGKTINHYEGPNSDTFQKSHCIMGLASVPFGPRRA